MTPTALVFDIFARVKTKTAGTSAEKGKEEETPGLGSASMRVFDFGHAQVITSGTVYHYGHTRVGSFSGIVCRIGLLDVYHIFLVRPVSDGREMAVAFVYCVIFCWYGRVYVPL